MRLFNLQPLLDRNGRMTRGGDRACGRWSSEKREFHNLVGELGRSRIPRTSWGLKARTSRFDLPRPEIDDRIG
jgi:hypothetical protein